MPTLKPCPFCGWLPEFVHVVQPDGSDTVELQCMNDRCTTNPCTECYDDATEAMAAWNNRYEPVITVHGQKIGAVL